MLFEKGYKILASHSWRAVG